VVEAFVVCVVMEIMDGWWVPLARLRPCVNLWELHATHGGNEDGNC
jgi:hypothetical protein